LDSTPKICVVGSGWQFTSGISYYTCRLASALNETYPTSTILMRRLIPRFLYPGKDRVGVQMHNVSYPPKMPVYDGVDWFWLPSIIGAVRFLRRERPRYVVFQWWTGAVLHSYLLLAFIARRLGAKVLIEFHETQDTGEVRLRGAARYVAMLGKRLFGKADGFVVHSEFDKKQISVAFDLAGRPLHVVPMGPFDHHAAEQAPAAEVSAPGPSEATTADAEGPFRLLFFGTIRPYKGLEYLVEAFNALSESEASQFHLTVVGETWEGWTRPLDLIKESPYADRITLINRYVRDEEVTGFFADADATVLPYTRSSGSGPLHISMHLGLPVVLTDVGGLRDAADDYDGIIWVSPESSAELQSAIMKLPAMRGERFTNVRTWSQSVESFTNLIADVERTATDSGAADPQAANLPAA